MPYIKKIDREKYETSIDNLVKLLIKGVVVDQRIGEVNYVISKIIWELFKERESYTRGNNLIGVLEAVKQEFYRRQLGPYEDKKITENGDI